MPPWLRLHPLLLRSCTSLPQVPAESLLGGMLGEDGWRAGSRTRQSRPALLAGPAGMARAMRHATRSELPVPKPAHQRKLARAKDQPALSPPREIPRTAGSLHSKSLVDSLRRSGVMVAPATTCTRISIAKLSAPLKRDAR